jgi:hypothetical protein
VSPNGTRIETETVGTSAAAPTPTNRFAVVGFVLVAPTLVLWGVPFLSLLHDDGGWRGMTTMFTGSLYYWPYALLVGAVSVIAATLGLRAPADRGGRGMAALTLILLATLPAVWAIITMMFFR